MFGSGHIIEMINRTQSNRQPLLDRRANHKKLRDKRNDVDIHPRSRPVREMNISKKELQRQKEKIRNSIKRERKVKMIWSISITIILVSVALYFVV